MPTPWGTAPGIPGQLADIPPPTARPLFGIHRGVVVTIEAEEEPRRIWHRDCRVMELDAARGEPRASSTRVAARRAYISPAHLQNKRSVKQTRAQFLLRSFVQRTTESLHPRPIHAQVVIPDTGCGTNVDHAFGHREACLEVIDEAQERATRRVNVIVRFGDDLGSRLVGEDALQASEERSRIPAHPNRSDTVPGECVAMAANAIRTIRTGIDLGGHAAVPQSSTACGLRRPVLVASGTPADC